MNCPARVTVPGLLIYTIISKSMKSFALKIALILFASVLVFSCTKDLEEINTNGNSPTAVPPSLLLPGVMRNISNEVVGTGWGIGNIVIQHTAKIQFVNEDRYAWGEINGFWNTTYANMRDLNNVYVLAEAQGLRNYMGLALVMKSWMFSIATDCYGDIPYSQATQGKGDNFFPVYDTQENIYNGILADLERANDLLESSPEAIEGDIILNGNKLRWRKLANSLLLRYLMRISNKRDVSAQMQAILADPVKYPIMESNADIAALTYLAASPNQFPIHTSRIGSFNEFRLSKTMGDTLIALGDPRLEVFARPTDASVTAGSPEFVGIPNGLDDIEALTYNGGSQFISRIGAVFYENAITSDGIDIARGFVMDYAELQFILAEAAQRGLITGDAKNFYEKGIQASMDYYKVTMPAGYLTMPEVAYNPANGLAQIGFQKWIGLFFHGLEGWFDWRRTGYPVLLPGKANLNENQIPVRFIYPSSEQALNSDNRNTAVSRQGVDNINTKVWWDQ